MRFSIRLHLISMSGNGLIAMAYTTKEPMYAENDADVDWQLKQARENIVAKAYSASRDQGADVITLYGREHEFDELFITSSALKQAIPRIVLVKHK